MKPERIQVLFEALLDYATALLDECDVRRMLRYIGFTNEEIENYGFPIPEGCEE